MNSKQKGYVVVVASLMILGGAFILFSNKKRYYANIIIKSGNATNYPTLMTFDTDYLKAWARAIKKNAPTFNVSGSDYQTKTGKKII